MSSTNAINFSIPGTIVNPIVDRIGICISVSNVSRLSLAAMTPAPRAKVTEELHNLTLVASTPTKTGRGHSEEFRTRSRGASIRHHRSQDLSEVSPGPSPSRRMRLCVTAGRRRSSIGGSRPHSWRGTRSRTRHTLPSSGGDAFTAMGSRDMLTIVRIQVADDKLRGRPGPSP